jgi:transposase
MARDRTFSDDQRDAAVGPVLQAGMSAAEAAMAAAAGELAVPPFDVAPTTITGWIAAHNRREGGQLAGNAEAQRARAWAEKQIARIEAIENPTAKDGHAMQQALRVLTDAERMTTTRGRDEP